MPKYLLLILLLAASIPLRAQTWEIGGQLGAAGYMGDLNTNNPLKPSGVAAGIFVRRNFDGYFSLKLNYTTGKIAGADSTSSNQQFRDRNLSFTDRLNELSLIGEFDFFKYIPDAGPHRFTPYIYLGIGIVGYNPQAVYQGQTYDLRPLTTEGETPYKKTAIAIPYGVGAKYNFSGKWSIMADLGYRNPNTDYLDDVSGYYPDPSKLPSDLARALSDRSGEKTGTYIGSPGLQRGDLRAHDTYVFMMVTLSFTFVTQKCYFQ